MFLREFIDIMILWYIDFAFSELLLHALLVEQKNWFLRNYYIISILNEYIFISYILFVSSSHNFNTNNKVYY